MNILSWNCHGLAAATTQTELRDLCRQQQPAIVFLMETRAPKGRVVRLQTRLRFEHSFTVLPRGTTGGLCLLWDSSVRV